jgi:uncharacterized protein YaiL (DUF2058 family)
MGLTEVLLLAGAGIAVLVSLASVISVVVTVNMLMAHIKGEVARQQLMAESAMRYLVAADPVAKVEADAAEQRNQIELKSLQDALEEEEQDVVQEYEPNFVKTTDGRQIDLNSGQWEVP